MGGRGKSADGAPAVTLGAPAPRQSLFAAGPSARASAVRSPLPLVARLNDPRSYDDPPAPLPFRPGPILVAGATGRQGSAVVRHLLRTGWNVRALTRTPESPAAQALAALGAELWVGDFADPESLDAALESAHGAFSVQPAAVAGTRREVAYGLAFADAARRAQVRHLVYSSIAGVERAGSLPQLRGKVRIEEHIHRLGVPTTVLRCAFLIDSLLTPGWAGALIWGGMAGALGRELPIQMTATDDIGAFAALAFADPDRFIGYAVELASDEVTLDRAKSAFRTVTGRSPRFIPLPFSVLRWIDRDLARLFDWIRTDGFQADLPSLQELYPDLKSLEAGLHDALERAQAES